MNKKQNVGVDDHIDPQNHGITLIALVVTIIVLLILAGISLNLIGGANGVLSRAQKAVDETKFAQLKESLELSNAEKLIDKYAEGEYSQDLYDYIKDESKKNPDKTVETSNGKYWLDDEDNMHYMSKSPEAGAELEKDQNGNPVIKNTENNNPDDGNTGDNPGGDTEKTVPSLTTSNTDFEYSPKGWTNGSVAVKAIPKDVDMTGCTIQTSKDGENWEDTDTQIFTENGTLHVRLVKDTEYGEKVTKEIDNIDTTKPEITEVVAESNKFVFKAKDDVSGLAGYAVTEDNVQPTNFTPIEGGPKEFQKLIENLKNDKTYYVWVKDQAGNVSESGARVDLSAVEGATSSNLTVGSTTWNGTNATVTFSTTSTLQIQWCTTQSTNDSDWTTGTSATVPSGTTIYVRLWDGTNGGSSYLAHTPILTYQVRYNANGGSGSMANSTHEYNKAQNLIANGFTKNGYTFAGWATSTDGAKVYEDNQSITNLSSTNGATVNLYAKWNQLTAASIITGTNYGDSVNYSSGGVTNWKIFSKYGNNVYLIAGNILEESQLNLGNGITNDSWAVYASAGKQDTLISWMKDTNYWTQFVNMTYADQATGGPTLARLAESFSGKTGRNYTAEMIQGMDVNNELYSVSQKWWLATPYSKDVRSVWYVERGYGSVVTSSVGANNYCGIRPLVRLKSNVVMTWNGSEWDLSI